MSVVSRRIECVSAGGRLLRTLGLLAFALIASAMFQPGVRAQANQWTWMSGLKEIPCPSGGAYCAAPAVYGTRGVAAPANTPGGRVGAVTWTDRNGNLWLFGGAPATYQAPNACTCFNDLWKYDPVHKLWTWIGGSNTQGAQGVYGTLGVASSSNVPGARYDAVGWTDSAGNLWLFGGWGTSYGAPWLQNDLWKFNVTTAQWTWVDGNNTYSEGISYGTEGVASPANDPGVRRGSAVWTDKGGRFWLFGGLTFGGFINDLWMYDPSLNEWAWMGGNTTVGAPGAYGTLGVPSVGNIPGAREGQTSWTDASGNFWLFGGADRTFAPSYALQLNDLWMFNPTTNEWTWAGGSSDANTASAFYGPQGVESPLSFPGPRSRSVGWTDHSGNLWLFGGDDGPGGPLGLYGELWRFNPANGEWAWVNGSDTWDYMCNLCTSGVYGTQRVASSLNLPGGRWFGSRWVDANGNLWLFGGFGVDDGTDIQNSGGELNDLWLYQTPSLPLTATPSITRAAGSATSSVTVTMSDATPGASIFYTANGSAPTTASTKYTGPVTLASTATVHAIAAASGRTNSSVATAVLSGFWSPAATPAFSPPGGIYAGAQAVTITDTTGGAVIYYTTDGSAPTTSSAVYAGPISVSPTKTVKAIALAAGYAASAVGSATYTLAPAAATPKFSLAPGTYMSAQTVTITDATSGAKIYFTIDGTTPTPSSALYSAPIFVPSSEVIQAIAMAGSYAPSAVAKATYNILPSASALKEWAWIPENGNVPGGGYRGASWTDLKGNLWFFGGKRYDSNHNFGLINDLWRYTTATGEWTRLSGNSVAGQPGVYGNLGEASPENVPGARSDTVTWTDPGGNLWLFGGFGLNVNPQGNFGALNDLWKYSPSTGLWTWMSGGIGYNQAGVYGTLGLAASANVPGARYGAVSWIDARGRFWVFGGSGVDANGVVGVLNDLWMYAPATRLWTWMAGSNMAAQHGVYGTLGTPAAGNVPGARADSAAWADASGNLWLFGGYDFTGPKGDWNDLWRYTLSTGLWTWMGGSNTSNQLGVYGSLGVPAASNVPSARNMGASWTDFNGNLWLFGGGGLDVNGNSGALNDLWRYTPSIKQWTWMGGSNLENQPSVYKTPGVFSAGNVPGARWGAVSWTDLNGNFWLFGGGTNNDLWEYVTPPAALKQQIRFSQPASPVVYGAKPITVFATGGASGNPVVFSVVSGPCATSGTNGITLTITGAGTCTVAANQAGNSNYAAALQVTRTIVVNKAPLTIAATNKTMTYGAALPAFTWTATGFVNGETASVLTGAPALSTAATSTSPPGTYAIKIVANTLSAMNYVLAFKAGTLTINPLGTMAAPQFHPAGGVYTGPQSVTITDSTGGGILYTTDGSVPSATHGTHYAGAITVSASETIKAIAVKKGYTPSAVVSATYTIQ